MRDFPPTEETLRVTREALAQLCTAVRELQRCVEDSRRVLAVGYEALRVASAQLDDARQSVRQHADAGGDQATAAYAVTSTAADRAAMR
jgi:hypothetical protein